MPKTDETANLLEETPDTGGVPADTSAAPPADIPAKFIDHETGAVKLDALVASYRHLEQKLSELGESVSRHAPPEKPEDYCVACDHGLFEADPEINRRLFEAGLSNDQAQTVYDLAAERMVPMILDIAAEFQADREVERLVQHFGGREAWAEMSRQIADWGRRNLPKEAFQGLSASYDGVLAMHRMMGAEEPEAMRAGQAASGHGEAEVRAMMKDPRYWRDRDPAFVDKVSRAFRRLYPDGE